MKKIKYILLITLLMLIIPISANAAYSGTCGANGDNLTWTLDDNGTLTINGTGQMRNYFYSSGTAPWESCRTGIKEVVIENGVTSIGSCAFYYCYSLESIEIPDSVTSIGYYAFWWCSSLISIEIPDSVTYIGTSAFVFCDNLTNVYITDIEAWCNIEFGDNTANPLYYADRLYINGKRAVDVVVPDGVTQIPTYAFSCDSLKSIEIPDSVTTIGSDAFSGCSGLTSIEIPDSVTEIGSYAFSRCYSLTDVYITDVGAWCNINIEFGSYDTNPLYYADNLFINGVLATDVVIPDGVTRIPMCAFSCDSLKSIEIPDSVTTIGGGAFSGCSGLTSIEIPDSVTTIGGSAFSGCSGLTSIEIPDSVTTIGGGAFSGCSGLTSIEIPGSITSWESSVFSDCNNLSKVTFKEGTTRLDVNPVQSMTALETIVIPESVIEIEPNTFAYCSKLRTVIYAGSEAEWNEMYMGSGNGYLTSAWIDFRNEIQVRLNGEIVLFDTYPEINNGRTMVPLRAIFEALDATVDWNGETRTVVSYKGGKIVSFAIDSNIMYVNGVPVELDSPAYIKDGRTLVPVRAVSEAFDINVDWNGETRTVNLTN